jgi:serine/threonine-protein kinase
VGIHQGEITFDAQGPYGDSVNIAARIQALAIPGSVLISGKVRDDIKNRPSIPTVRLGMFAMKNVAEPVEVHAVAVEGLEVPTPAHVSAAQAAAESQQRPLVAASEGPAPAAASSRSRQWLWLAALVTLAVAAGLALGSLMPRSRPAPVTRFAVTPGEGAALLPNVAGVDIAISEDGFRIAYVGQAPGSTQLWERSLEALSAVPIRGTTNARDPVFSPDGRAVAFRVGNTLRVSTLGGSLPTTLVDADVGGGPDWGPDGMIYYPVGAQLYRIASSGGDPEAVTSPTAGLHRYPDALPGGRHLLFTIEVPRTPQESRIAVMDLRDRTIRELGPGVFARYAQSGHVLLGTADGTVRAAPFDLERAEITGASATVLTAAELRNGPTMKFAISATGMLVYRTGLMDPIVMQFAWVTRSGRATLVDPEWTFNPGTENRAWDLSPDGSQLALKAESDLGEDIWVKPIPTGPIARFTFTPSEERMPRWSPDGRTIAFLSPRDDNFDVWSRRADGTGDAVLLADLEESIAEMAWSPDGRSLLVRTAGIPGVIGGRDIYAVPLDTEGGTSPLLSSPADEAAPALSPDGRWLAYSSDELGRREVFVRPYPNVQAGHFQVSSGGGRAPAWSSDGSELFFIADATNEGADSRRMMVAPIDRGPPFRVLTPQTLFEIDDNYYLANNSISYRVADDDERFLMARFLGEGARIELVFVQNFFEVLRERAPR